MRALGWLVLVGLMVGCRTAPEPEEAPAEELEAPEEREEGDVDEEILLPEGFDVQGHRGARGLSPENTLPSLEVALDLLVDTLEIDFHLSADDWAVAWHDPYLDASLCRVPEGEEGLPDPDELPPMHEDLRVRNLTREQLSRYICDRNPDVERFPDQSTSPTALAGDEFRIVTLERIFEFVAEYAESPEKTAEQRENASRVRFNLETKRVEDRPEFIGDGFHGETPGLFERQLLAAVRAHGMEERVMLQSFDHRSLWAARSIAPWLTLVALDREIETPFEEFRDRGVSVWSPRARLVTEETVAAAQDAGLQVIPWTVNDPAEMERLIRLGVDGIITDRPDLLVVYRR
jgi:glycerophosphoryl diester phosphodiesterase